MSKEKQIEEMAKVIKSSISGLGFGKFHLTGDQIGIMFAKSLYNAGYRKQSEWISVEERLPTVEEQARGLVGIVNGFNGKIRFENARVFLNYDYNFDEWYSQDCDIQNCKIECWMPLPEAPKMKGGAE